MTRMFLKQLPSLVLELQINNMEMLPMVLGRTLIIIIFN